MYPLNRAGKEPRERCFWGKAVSELGLLLRLCHGTDLSVHQSVNSNLLKKKSTKLKNKLKQSFLQAVLNEFPAMLHSIFLLFWVELSLQKLKKLHEIFVWELCNGKNKSNSHRKKNI